jgi:hypothetical protein
MTVTLSDLVCQQSVRVPTKRGRRLSSIREGDRGTSISDKLGSAKVIEDHNVAYHVQQARTRISDVIGSLGSDTVVVRCKELWVTESAILIAFGTCGEVAIAPKVNLHSFEYANAQGESMELSGLHYLNDKYIICWKVTVLNN